MNLKIVSLAGAVVLSSACAAHAQSPCGLHTHFRIVTNMSDATGPGELRLDSGWVTTRPHEMPGSITTTNPQGMTSSGSCTATADYGDLRCVASGSGTTVPGIGAFLWLDEWIGGAPKAEYSDSFTVVSSSLPAGTPVDVAFTLSLAGTAQVIDTNPVVNLRAELQAGDNGGASVQTPLTGVGTTTVVLHTAVGRTGTIRGRLNASLFANGLLGGGAITSTLSCNLRATTSASVTTAGATLSTCSGVAYSGCGSADFDGDGDSGTDFDILAFFACIGGNCCPACGSADFDGDGDTATDFDIQAFFRVLGGGSC